MFEAEGFFAMSILRAKTEQYGCLPFTIYGKSGNISLYYKGVLSISGIIGAVSTNMVSNSPKRKFTFHATQVHIE